MEMIAKVACFVLFTMIVVVPHAEASLTCGQVENSLLPCVSYLTSGGAVPETCCSGVKSLNAAAEPPAARCLKSLQFHLYN
ncbi:hypothetical protein Leryth_013421 [Lithospermum erythrorhizon]|nr:hypothetical protein Leryth_013421 [Lithospermum erythrorhizon]